MLRSFGRRFDPARLHRRRAAIAKAVAVLRFEEPGKKFTPAHAGDPARLHRRRAAIAKAVAARRSENKERSSPRRMPGIPPGSTEDERPSRKRWPFVVPRTRKEVHPGARRGSRPAPQETSGHRESGGLSSFREQGKKFTLAHAGDPARLHRIRPYCFVRDRIL